MITIQPGQCRILVVDDDETARFGILQVLRKAGYQTLAAASGQQAWELVRAARPDLILLDVDLPDADGRELCYRIKMDADLGNVFVVMFSANRTATEDQVDGLGKGADGYITQPVTNQELLARLEALVRLQQHEYQLRERTADLQREMAERRRAEEALLRAHAELEQRIRERTAELALANERLQQRDRLLDGVAKMTRQLLTAEPLEGEMGSALGVLGGAAGADRACVFQKVAEPGAGGLRWRPRWEWAGGRVAAEAGPARLPAELLPPGRLENLSQKQAFQCLVEELDPASRPILGGRGIRSLLLVPIHVANELWGLAEFNDCTHSRVWQEAEIAVLQTAADAIGGALKRQQGAEELRRVQALLDAAIEQSPAGILIADAPDCRIRLANSSALGIRGGNAGQLTGISAEQHPHQWQVHTPEGALMAPADLPLCRAIYKGETVHNLEAVIHHSSGEKRWILANAAPVRGAQGEILAGVVVFLDITQRRKLEDQLRQTQKLESIGQLAGGVAHDFNNILAAILMQMNLVLECPGLEPGIRTALKEVVQSAQRAADLTRQLLMFSRRSVLETRIVDLNDLARNLLKMLGRLIREDIQLVLECGHPLPPVEADPGMLEQVLMNLAVNARDAMPQGGRLVIGTEAVTLAAAQARLNPERRAGRFACLRVSDRGLGMEEETLKHIFEPFFTTKKAGLGTGLGLATVHGIVAQHKGWIEVESRLGSGSTFRVFLPAAPELAEAKFETEPDGLGMPLPPGRETILLVEDSAPLLRVTGQALRRLGYQVLEAPNGPAALAVWQRQQGRVDLLFTDMVMPEGISGQALAEKLRAENPGLKVIITSGYQTELGNPRLLASGNLHYLLKPYESASVARLVRTCLDDRSAL